MRVLLFLFVSVSLLCLPATAHDRAWPVQDDDADEIPDELDEPESDDSDDSEPDEEEAEVEDSDDAEPEPEPESE